MQLNTFQEVGVFVFKSTINFTRVKTGFSTRHKSLVNLKNRKTRLDFVKEHIKWPVEFWNNEDEEMKCSEAYHLICEASFTVWAHMAAEGAVLLCSLDVTVGKKQQNEFWGV